MKLPPARALAYGGTARGERFGARLARSPGSRRQARPAAARARASPIASPPLVKQGTGSVSQAVGIDAVDMMMQWQHHPAERSRTEEETRQNRMVTSGKFGPPFRVAPQTERVLFVNVTHILEENRQHAEAPPRDQFARHAGACGTGGGGTVGRRRRRDPEQTRSVRTAQGGGHGSGGGARSGWVDSGRAGEPRARACCGRMRALARGACDVARSGNEHIICAACDCGTSSAAVALRWYRLTTSCGRFSHTRRASLQPAAGLVEFQSTRNTSNAVGRAKLGGHAAGPPPRRAACAEGAPCFG